MPQTIPPGLRRLEPEEWAAAVFQTTPRTLTEAISEQPPKKPNGKANRTLTDEQLWGDR